MRNSSEGSPRDLRLRQLQGVFAARGALPLRDAAKLLKVSPMTIRRDLAGPDAPLACRGAHVVGNLPTASAGYDLEAERDLNAADKQRACQRAAELVRPGDSLFIDCGTTMPHLAAALPRDIPLSIVCYSLNIATLVSARPRTQLILLGGLYHGSSATFFSVDAVAYLRSLGIDKAFISAGGVHPTRGASCSNFNEVAVKQAAIASAAETILVIDDRKLGQMKPAFFSPLSAFDRILVGGSVPARRRAQFKGVRLECLA